MRVVHLFAVVALASVGCSKLAEAPQRPHDVKPQRMAYAPHLVSAFEHASVLMSHNSPDMAVDTRVALLEASLERPGSVPDAELTPFARSTIHAALAENHWGYSARLWKRLPATMREAFLAEAGTAIASDAGRASEEARQAIEEREVFLVRLAMALLAVGDPLEARHVRDKFPAPSDGECEPRLGRAILDWHLGGDRAEDTFDLVELYLSCRPLDVPEPLLVPIAGERYGTALSDHWEWKLEQSPETLPSGDTTIPRDGIQSSTSYDDLLAVEDARDFYAFEEAVSHLPDGAKACGADAVDAKERAALLSTFLDEQRRDPFPTQPRGFKVLLRSADGTRVFIEWWGIVSGGLLRGTNSVGKWTLEHVQDWEE